MSLETDAIIAYVQAQVPDAVVSATLGRYINPQNPCAPHSPGSYHCKDGTGGKGTAVDWGGTPAQQLAAFNALKPVAGQLAELIHNAFGITMAVKNGRWVDPVAVYGPTVWAAHTNHTHVAVNAGTILPVPAPAEAPAQPAPPKVPIPLKEVTGVRIASGMIGPVNLDPTGRGWVSIQAPLERIMFIEERGSAPARDGGYWAVLNHDVNDSGPETIVTLYGAPGEEVYVYYKVLEEA